MDQPNSESPFARLGRFAREVLFIIAAVLALPGLISQCVMLYRGEDTTATVVTAIILALVLGGLLVYIYSHGHRSLSRFRIRLIALALVMGLIVGIITWWWPEDRLPSGWVRVVVTQFVGPRTEHYRVTESVIENLRDAAADTTRGASGIDIVALKQSVTAEDGSDSAHALGTRRDARIVLWGWYGTGATDSACVRLTAHFELLHKPKYLELRQQIMTVTAPIAELESFRLQDKLSKEMTFLTLMTIAMVRYESEDYETAVTFFDQALDQEEVPEQMIDPFVVYLYKGNAHLKLGNLEDAFNSYDSALVSGHEMPDIWSNRGITLISLGRYEEAAASFDSTLARDPDNEFAKSIQAQMALIESPPWPEPDRGELARSWYDRGLANSRQGHFEAAVAFYDSALFYKPDFTWVWLERGQALDTLDQPVEAVASYDKFLVYMYVPSRSVYSRALDLDRRGQHAEAIAAYDSSLVYQRGIALAHRKRGDNLSSLGRSQEADDSYDSSLVCEGECSTTWYNRGRALDDLGRHDEAVASYDSALIYVNAHAPSWYYRGYDLERLGRYEEAVASFDSALFHRRGYSEAWCGRGSALNQIGHYEEAVANFDSALVYRHDYSWAWFDRGWAVAHLGRYGEAVGCYNCALVYEPDHSSAWHGRGCALRQLGRNQEAAASFDSSRKYQPMDAVARDLMRSLPCPSETDSAKIENGE